MDKVVLEKRVFELSVSALSAASGLMREPPAYGALRVMAILRDLVEILEEQDLASPRLLEIKKRIDESRQGGMLSNDERQELLNQMVLQGLEKLD